MDLSTPGAQLGLVPEGGHTAHILSKLSSSLGSREGTSH